MKNILIATALMALIAVPSFAANSDSKNVTINIDVESWVEIELMETEFTMTIDGSGAANNSAGDHDNFEPSATIEVTANAPYTLTANGDDSFVRSTDSNPFWKAVDGSNIIGYYIALKKDMLIPSNSNNVLYGNEPNEISYVVDPAVMGRQTEVMGIGGALDANNTPDGTFALPGIYTGTVVLTATIN